ncbi:N-acetylmuramoyl-L-alanine amidase-like domain-containing protein [Aquimarina macrocephali]|uniref:N-acetylmuramoyl-L-alanine amidase-like domain-containing protein n=1 Tax=Aquimarina macrocephali TaxID=666563 RepID=UPI0004657ADD|nr:N-acetylmuramoyl-L-alanine amidase-like domain-containing protein [Aquimarina macrocephali]
MKYKSLLLLFIVVNSIAAQEIICSAKDKEIFTTRITTLKKEYTPKTAFGETLVFVGKTFLGTPYAAKTLEIGSKESLVINFQGLDCTTFVENVLVLSLMLKNEKDDFDTYTTYLEKVRYKNGKLDGYASRLHYFSEWITNNEQKGILKNITGDIGGIEIEKDINFMSTHRELYPFLKDDKNFKGIQQSETNISQSSVCFLPKDQIKEYEESMMSGDIIALTTSIKGLDITHTGIAIRKKDGRIHLLHASSKGQVEISTLPLVDYLKKIKNNTGIIVNRVL